MMKNSKKTVLPRVPPRRKAAAKFIRGGQLPG
jgi:hypothetical protein